MTRPIDNRNNPNPQGGTGNPPQGGTPPTNPPASPPPPGDQPPQGEDGQPPGGDTPTAADLQARYLDAVSKHQAESYQLKQQNQQLQAQFDELKGQVDGWKQDPYAAIESLGGSPDEYLNRVVNDGKPSTDSVLQQQQARIDQLEQQLQQRSQTEQEQEDEAKRMAYFRSHADQVRDVLKGDDYKDASLAMQFERELFGRDADLVGLVRGPFEQKMQTMGVGLTPAESAGNILKESQQLIERLRGSQALKQILGLQTEQPPNQAGNPPQGPQTRTITEQTGTVSQTKDPSKMSQAEWEQYAAREYAARANKQ